MAIKAHKQPAARSETKRVLMEMQVPHHTWIKKSAKEIGVFEKEILKVAIDFAIANDALERFRQKRVTSELQATMDQLAEGAKTLNLLKVRGEELLKKIPA